MSEEIECSLEPLPEYGSLGAKAPKYKHGRYINSSFWDIKDYGIKRWVIGTYIKCNMDLYERSFTIEEIVRGCLNFLNKPPKRKKYAKKDPKPVYGKLELYRYKLLEKNGSRYLSVLLITQLKKNKLFWGKGINGG